MWSVRMWSRDGEQWLRCAFWEEGTMGWEGEGDVEIERDSGGGSMLGYNGWLRVMVEE